MTKQIKEKLKTLPYYGKIKSKGRYKGVKDKAWAILSDFCRQRDYIKYHACVSCNKHITEWKDHDAGHYFSMGGHGALLGFSPLNIHLQCSSCNLHASQHTGVIYRDTLIARYGEAILGDLEELKRSTVKADDWHFIKVIEEVYGMYQELKEEYPEFTYPEYL